MRIISLVFKEWLTEDVMCTLWSRGVYIVVVPLRIVM